MGETGDNFDHQTSLFSESDSEDQSSISRSNPLDDDLLIASPSSTLINPEFDEFDLEREWNLDSGTDGLDKTQNTRTEVSEPPLWSNMHIANVVEALNAQLPAIDDKQDPHPPTCSSTFLPSSFPTIPLALTPHPSRNGPDRQAYEPEVLSPEKVSTPGPSVLSPQSRRPQLEWFRIVSSLEELAHCDDDDKALFGVMCLPEDFTRTLHGVQATVDTQSDHPIGPSDHATQDEADLLLQSTPETSASILSSLNNAPDSWSPDVEMSTEYAEWHELYATPQVPSLDLQDEGSPMELVHDIPVPPSLTPAEILMHYYPVSETDSQVQTWYHDTTGSQSASSSNLQADGSKETDVVAEFEAFMQQYCNLTPEEQTKVDERWALDISSGLYDEFNMAPDFSEGPAALYAPPGPSTIDHQGEFLDNSSVSSQSFDHQPATIHSTLSNLVVDPPGVQWIEWTTEELQVDEDSDSDSDSDASLASEDND
ncbi:hypothetical protein HGRIS_010020 [Hohenbuehelia grisea]|uniref:Uncharacterized protein n=1 Tax=Hohenbuehelia grisea TaxID=104357 RepID=A0ABR3J3E1_9AGAR